MVSKTLALGGLRAVVARVNVHKIGAINKGFMANMFGMGT